MGYANGIQVCLWGSMSKWLVREAWEGRDTGRVLIVLHVWAGSEQAITSQAMPGPSPSQAHQAEPSPPTDAGSQRFEGWVPNCSRN